MSARARKQPIRAGGFAIVQSVGRDLTRLLDGLGQRYELLDNTYKPYPTASSFSPPSTAASRSSASTARTRR